MNNRKWSRGFCNGSRSKINRCARSERRKFEAERGSKFIETNINVRTVKARLMEKYAWREISSVINELCFLFFSFRKYFSKKNKSDDKIFASTKLGTQSLRGSIFWKIFSFHYSSTRAEKLLTKLKKRQWLEMKSIGRNVNQRIKNNLWKNTSRNIRFTFRNVAIRLIDYFGIYTFNKWKDN